MKIYWRRKNLPALHGLSARERRAAIRSVIGGVWKQWQVWLPHAVIIAVYALFRAYVPPFPHRLSFVAVSAFLLLRLAALPANHLLQQRLSSLGYGSPDREKAQPEESYIL